MTENRLSGKNKRYGEKETWKSDNHERKLGVIYERRNYFIWRSIYGRASLYNNGMCYLMA
jgi:hypothetical protein